MRRYFLVGSVTLVVAALMYLETAASPSDDKASFLDRLLDAHRFSSVLTSLLLYFAYKVVVTALSVTLPLPVGLFTPVFLTGGVLGRIIGESPQSSTPHIMS